VGEHAVGPAWSAGLTHRPADVVGQRLGRPFNHHLPATNPDLFEVQTVLEAP